MRPLAWLFARLAVALVVVSLLGDALVWAAAPRWLLLDHATVLAAMPVALFAMSLAIGIELVVLAALVGGLRPLSRELSDGAAGDDKAPRGEARHVLALYALPARMAAVHVATALTVALGTVLPFVRPAGVDLYTATTLALLSLTLIGTASLPLYVMARSRVASVMERVPAELANEAVHIVDRKPGRVRWRFLAAVAAPVALVAIGASLLVLSHLRAYETGARKDDARAAVAATVDLVDGRQDGRMAALVAATSLGLHVEIDHGNGAVAADADPDEVVFVPLEDGRAIVTLSPVGLAAETVAWAFIALGSVVVAALLGRQLGAVLVREVALAKTEIEAMGAADVMRGSLVLSGARFDVVRALGDAIDRLGGVFREFAAAQERAIIARASMERTRAMFLASMSHDLRSPLNAILGFASLASRDPQLSPAQRESVAIIEQRGRELLALIQTVLDSARAEAGQLVLAREAASPGDVVDQAVREAKDLLSGTNVGIEGETAADLPKVRLDSGRVAQAIVAITTSAARAGETGKVRVHAEIEGDWLRIDVAALGGSPLAPERLSAALESPERARRLGSMGLGLQLARAIVSLHGGEIKLDLHRDEGPIVTMRLPARAGDASVSLPG